MMLSNVNLTRSGSFDTGYGVLDDATSSEGRYVRIDATRITLISLRLVQQGTQREALTKFYQMPKVSLLKTKINSVSEQKDKNRHRPSKQFGPKLQ